MRELSIMVDESGEWGKLSKYYLITLVFHDQSEPVMPHIERYEQHLADASLPDIPFHAGPLLNGHADYETLSMADRKRLFVAFFTLARNLPFTAKASSTTTNVVSRLSCGETWRTIC